MRVGRSFRRVGVEPDSLHLQEMIPLGCLRDSAGRLRRGGGLVGWEWCLTDAPFRAPVWCTSGGDGTREAGGTAVESLVGRRTRTSVPWLSKVRIWRFLRGKLISDHGLFSSSESQQGAANGLDSRGVCKGYILLGALDGWMLARTPASPAQGLPHLGPRYYNFPRWACWPKLIGASFVSFVAESAACRG